MIPIPPRPAANEELSEAKQARSLEEILDDREVKLVEQPHPFGPPARSG